MAWRLPVVVVGERYDRALALKSIRQGASDWLSSDRLELLDGVLKRETGDPESSGVFAASRLVAPVAGAGGLDEYCAGLAGALRADAALVLVRDRAGELAASGAFLPEWERGVGSLRMSRDQLSELRGGTPSEEVWSLLGLKPAASVLCTDLVVDGRSFGLQIVARQAEGFSAEELGRAESLARLAASAAHRAHAVEQLRRNDSLKTEFVRTVSHELRTPLNTVIGYADLLVDEVFGALDEEQRKVLRRVGDRGRGLLEVIAATLELPGVDSGRVSLETRPISISALMAEIEADAREWRVRDDLVYTWDIAGDLPSIVTDAGKLRVLLKNLIANATKFTDRGGITVRARPQDGGVEFSVEDTGIGIEGDAVHFVFDAFRQASAANTRQYGGVGLGLYIVRRLAGMLGGRLRVESEVGVGSKFFVWLPAQAP
jgi:signal transduction histidine kinase